MTYCAGVSPLLATPTTSASVRLWHDARCRPAAFEILFQKGDGKWHSHEQIGWSLPFELGSLHCGSGCSFRLRGLNASEYASRERIFNLSAEHHHLLTPQRPGGGALESATSEVVATPRPPLEAPHPPAVRLELFVTPPLAAPLERSLSRYVEGLVKELTSPHFYVTRERIQPVEASPTGER